MSAAIRRLFAHIAPLAGGRHPEPPALYGLSECDADTVMTAIYQRGDRLIGLFLLCHAAAAFGLAFVYDTWFITIVTTACALSLFFVNVWLLPRSFTTRVAAGVALQTFVALFIYQMHGLAEMHFWFFVAFTMMIVYQDWLCMWPGTLLILGQHFLFALLHNAGVQLYFFEADYISLMKLTFHFGIALIHVGVCGYWSVLLRRQTLADAGHRAKLGSQAHHLEDARDEALSAVRVKTDFLASMSHEIRTPMNGVIGMTGLLRETPLTDEQREYVEVIHRSGDSLLRIINDILDLSKIEAGRMGIEVAGFSVETVFGDAIDLFTESARAKGLHLEWSMADGVPRHLAGDAGRIRQILVNLIGNAIKFTEQGSITIAVTASAEDACLLRVEVRDTGMGVSPEAQARLFHPFSQIDASATRRFGGSGLGLAICRRLAELMGGDIGIVSDAGHGSTFWFTVRLQPAEEHDTGPVEVMPAAVVPCRVPPWRVLVVEDNMVNQLVASSILKKMHCHVDVVADGREGVESISSLPYDLVLMDCQMPVMDGYEAAARIRQLAGPRSAVPIVALTASVLDGGRERCLAAGMDDYVSKPVTADRLVRVLSRWLGDRHQPGVRPASSAASDLGNSDIAKYREAS